MIALRRVSAQPEGVAWLPAVPRDGSDARQYPPGSRPEDGTSDRQAGRFAGARDGIRVGGHGWVRRPATCRAW